MKKGRIDFTRIAAVAAVLIAIAYFYLNIFSPSLIPKSLRIGIPRKPINILILGTDITYDAVTHKPMPRLEGRADTILLAHVDPIKFQINILSIPRDTYLAIPGHGMQRINVANAYGGVSLVKETVSNFTLQKIDYYIKIKPNAITKIVELLGGISLYVDEDMRYIDRAQNLNINLRKGWQSLSGKQAHDYIRYRDKIRGDIGRIGRQQIFLKALMQAFIRPTNIFKAPFVIRSALQEVETNLPLSLTIRLLNLARMTRSHEIKTNMLPGDVSFVEEVGSVWLPDEVAFKKTIEEYF